MGSNTKTDAAELAARCERAGFLVTRTKDGYRVLGDEGQTAAFHLTPSDGRWKSQAMRQLNKMGLAEREEKLAKQETASRKRAIQADAAAARRKAETTIDARPTDRNETALIRAAGEYAVHTDPEWIFRKHPGPAVRQYLVTPEIAVRMLKFNERNRHLKASNSENIETSIVEGRFILTHQGVAFDIDGIFIDGQHRIKAIVDTGIALPLFVFVGIDPRAREFIDTHAVRSGADTLQMRKNPPANARSVAALIRLVWLHDNYPPGRWTQRRMDNARVGEQFDLHPDRWMAAVRMGRNSRQQQMGYSSNPISALTYMVGRAGGDMALMEQLHKGYRTGYDLSRGNPIAALRKEAIAMTRPDGPRWRTSVQLRHWLMAWNALVSDRDLVSFPRTPVDAPLPEITTGSES